MRQRGGAKTEALFCEGSTSKRRNNLAEKLTNTKYKIYKYKIHKYTNQYGYTKQREGRGELEAEGELALRLCFVRLEQAEK